uniref:Uncharacterized protein n=1 Tax=Ditylenchus dipsaci TaxID=166011 RepID=A0A915E8G7_9BILA
MVATNYRNLITKSGYLTRKLEHTLELDNYSLNTSESTVPEQWTRTSFYVLLDLDKLFNPTNLDITVSSKGISELELRLGLDQRLGDLLERALPFAIRLEIACLARRFALIAGAITCFDWSLCMMER